MHPRLLLLTTLFMASGALAAAPKPDCANASTTPEMTQCAALDADAAEAKLNATYKQLIQNLSQPDTESEQYSETRQKLQIAQRAWIKFRDADCEAVYQANSGGTLRGLAALGCKRNRAEQRTRELQDYLQP
ncbi:lysozyme inhibitor LprI family protein [Pseudomonas sp.]|uniref:lysozyme inhibitor LprI family protein n=1 Tax=Pseudomonas sp. TaxID=306 RepID=UPI002591215D|nr:lysozyme inhibitor LprI family protein [Pseudomonas sp.]